MDQIVFIFDLESFLPPSVSPEEEVDILLERGLRDLKAAALKLLTYGRVLERPGELSSFGFRFYSSSGYFSVAPAVTGDWHELSLTTWEMLEDVLRERFDSVLSALQRAEPGTRLRGRLVPATAACKALDEVTVLYPWDRPALFSPVKSARKSELRLGNTVFLVTRLPDSLDDLPDFLGVNQSRVKPRQVTEHLLSKRTTSHFTGELNISLHILNTRTQHSDHEVVQIFDKALKEVKGGVMQLSSLSNHSVGRVSTSTSSDCLLQPQTVRGFLPASAVISSHLATCALPARLLERNFYEAKIVYGDGSTIQLELRGGALPDLKPVCFVRSSTLQHGQVWARTSLVWSRLSEDTRFTALLSFLQLSEKCLLLEDPDGNLVVMFYNSDSTATLGFLDKRDSSLYQQIFGLKVSGPKINEELSSILDKVEKLQLNPPRKLKTPSHFKPFDGSSLESWRVPNPLMGDFLEKIKSSQSSQNEFHQKMMLKVRECYVSRTGMPEQEASKFTKKLSAMSNASTTSASSSGGLGRKASGRGARSRGEMLKDLSVLNRSSALLDSEETTKKEEISIENEMLTGKTKAAEEMMTKIGEANVSTDVLIDKLVDIQRDVTDGSEDLVLAGYSEACVSVLLKHLDIPGVSKTSLEDVVTSRLLVDVARVAQSSQNNLSRRVSSHKVQVLLAAEVHWLLASRERQEEYEESILAHLRQISLHGGQAVMTDFLSGPLTQCYVDRQPELLCLLYDELEQQRPSNLPNLSSPVRSVQPNSVKSTGSLGPTSAGAMQPPAPAIKVNKASKVNLSRSFRGRPASFDTSLTSRQIDISGPTRREKKSNKLVTTGRMVSTKHRISGKKKLLANKSPRKTKQMVKRNLNFDGSGKSPDRGKSPRKNISVTTPSKARKYQNRPLRTPGKTHTILCPETPARKGQKRKSDGNTSVADTPEKMQETLTPRRLKASLEIRRRASFYPGTKVDQVPASLPNTSTLDMSAVLDQSQMGLNKSLVLFPHLHDRKRKREDSLGPSEEADGGRSPLRKARKRLNSFSEQDVSLGRPLESTHLLSTAHLGQHLGQHIEQHLGDKLNISSIPSANRTPVKATITSSGDFFSPSKRVHFNMKPQPPTPKSGMKAKSILKTPSKESPVTGPTFKTPVKTPSKVATKLMQSPASQSKDRLTPVKITPRKNIGPGSGQTIRTVEDYDESSLPSLLTPVKIKSPRVMKAPSCQSQFLPPMMSTLQPAGDGISNKESFNPSLASTKADLQFSSTVAMTTQDIINSTSLTSTLIKPSSNIHSDIFDNSALFPSSLATLKGDSSLPSANQAEITPETTPTKTLERTPVKAGFEEDEELELVSPTKKGVIENIVRSLDDSDSKIVASRGKFGKTDSEQSEATSGGRTSTEPGPSSGYFSERHPDSQSPEYNFGQDSPPVVQVPSPQRTQQAAKPRRNKELEGLQDLMSPYFSTDSSKRRSAKPKSEAKQGKSVKKEKIKNKKRDGSTVEDAVTPSSKKSCRSVRSVFYKEIESEGSPTDDEEYNRIVTERFRGSEELKDDHDKNDNKTSEKKLIMKSPARFKCGYCRKVFRMRKSKLAHEAECDSMKQLVDQEDKEEQEERQETERDGSGGVKTVKTPNMVSSLQDHLSAYFSPSESGEGGGTRDRRATERLSDSYSLANLTPKTSRPQSRAVGRVRSLRGEGATSTPNDGSEGGLLSSRRTARVRTVSYAEFPDFDTTDSDVSQCESYPRKARGKKLVLNSRASISPLVSTRERGGLVVKDLNDSQEIQDLTDKNVSRKVRSREVTPQPQQTPEKCGDISVLSSGNTSLASPGKYFSVARVTETPTGQIKLKLNRINKPQQNSSTPIPSQEKMITNMNIKMSRSVCREMMMSPSRIVSIMTAKTPPKPVQVKTPEKENLPITVSELRKENAITKTPKIRIKKIPSAKPSSSSDWKAETILSPEKAVPALGESPARSFSPLTSSSLHKLTTSPIINTQVEGKKQRKKNVNKKLSYKFL